LSLATASPTDDLDAIRAALKERLDGVLDDVARRHDVSLRVVLDLLPAVSAKSAPGAPRSGATSSVWGPVTSIVTPRMGSSILRRAAISTSVARVRSVATSALRDARRSFCRPSIFGRRSCSLQFINLDGGAMFKVFVGRDEKRERLADHLARFERLRGAETAAA
jgi:putative heme iron utilization protein